MDVKLIRPKKRNALDPDMFHAIAEAGRRLKETKGVRCVVISGEGKSFCAGLDLSSMQRLAELPPQDGSKSDHPAAMYAKDAITHNAQQIAWVWQELRAPVIAAVQGHALGGGLQLALGADLRIVHPKAKLSLREVHWGIIPDMTATYFLQRLVRVDIAKDLVFTARIISGTRAHEIGLATELSSDPYARAHELAREIANRNPEAIFGAKALLSRPPSGPAEQLAAEREVIFSLMGTNNQMEAVMSSMQKRTPQFTDPDI